MSTTPAHTHHGIKDNHNRGRVADFLADKISQDSQLSVVSAYFTIYAYEALSKQLDNIDSLKFLFGEPRFIQALDPEKTDKKAFKIEDEGLELANRLQQREVARRCAAWINEKVEIRSVRESNLLHGKLYHIDSGKREHALMGSSNFTLRGLGLSNVPNIELNMVVDSDRDRADLKAWFDEIWADTSLVYGGDAKAQAPFPIIRQTDSRPAKALLAKARELLPLGYIANYTRQAFEYGLRKGCELQKVPMTYTVDPAAHKAQDFLDALKKAPCPASIKKADWTACFQRIEMFKNVVMNPYSHPSAPNIPRQEVVDAADAVDKFLELVGKK
mgnify:CR=1 FL=1